MLIQIKHFLISLMMASSDIQPAAAVDLNELSCLTHGIFYEAAAEPYEGKVGVANVIVNRTKSPHFSDTVCKVLKEKGQFSYWKRVKKINLNDEKVKAQLDAAASAAAAVLSGEAEDNTKGALYFANVKTASDRGWINRMTVKFKKTVRIANHTFFKKREGKRNAAV